jgi:hypothetical protein
MAHPLRNTPMPRFKDNKLKADRDKDGMQTRLAILM